MTRGETHRNTTDRRQGMSSLDMVVNLLSREIDRSTIFTSISEREVIALLRNGEVGPVIKLMEISREVWMGQEGLSRCLAVFTFLESPHVVVTIESIATYTEESVTNIALPLIFEW